MMMKSLKRTGGRWETWQVLLVRTVYSFLLTITKYTTALRSRTSSKLIFGRCV